MPPILQALVILLVLLLFQKQSKAQFTFNSKPPDVVYVEAGETLHLNVNFTYNAGVFAVVVLWSFNGKTLVQKIGSRNPESALPGRADIEGQGSLVLKNMSLRDNGTYRFSWFGSVMGSYNFTFIILEQPTAVINCSNPTMLNEGGDLTCLCDHTRGNPPPTAIWSKDGSDRDLKTGYSKTYLVLKNVGNKNAGTYKCTVRSHNLQDDKSFKLVVQSKLIEVSSTMTYSTSTPRLGKDSEKSNCDTTHRFGWYIILVTLVCGIVIGMIFRYGIMSLRQRFKSKKDHSKPAHNYDTPEIDREGAAGNSAYQELELQNREPENSYQALKMNTRRRMNNETKIEDEAGYQELDKVREKGDSYQSLTRS